MECSTIKITILANKKQFRSKFHTVLHISSYFNNTRIIIWPGKERQNTLQTNSHRNLRQCMTKLVLEAPTTKHQKLTWERVEEGNVFSIE